jgi:hypothetical protein
MTALAERRAGGAPDQGPAPGPRAWIRRELPWLAPSVAAAVNALAFALVAPNVNDIFAAVARESAALHGVGLKYWFSWFGGGSTPGNYSVLTPYLSAAIGAVPLAAIATAAITPTAWLALRGTPHPVAGLWVATATAALNLWSGRVPFALGCLFSVVTAIFLLRRRAWAAAAFAVLTVAASPVSAAFLAIILGGVFLACRDWRRICVAVALPLAVALVAVAALFGQPGPESFSLVQLLQLIATLSLFLIASPPSWLRTSIWLTLVASPLVLLVPNGLGDNLLRFAWYCLPALVVATSARAMRLVWVAVVLALGFATKQSIGDVFAGSAKTASPGYYTTLAHELNTLHTPLRTYRLEVVEDGTHTASYALLDHAMLARGYEYQEDNALNKVLGDPDLDATEYKLWLDNNAVGYVVIARTHRKMSPEYALVSEHRPGYLVPEWSDSKWTLYRVQDPTPLVKAPVTVAAFTQSKLVLRVPCACKFTVRVRKPANLRAVATPSSGSNAARSGARPAQGRLEDDGFGWTTMTTPEPGVYTLSGKTTAGIVR